MLLLPTGLLGLLIGIAAPGPCALLLPAEIEGVAGGTARGLPSTTGTIATGPARGKPIHQCAWLVAATHSDLIVTIVPQVSPANSAEVLSVLASRVDGMIARGWSVSSDSTAGVRCSTVTPPARARQPMISQCLGAVKGVALSVALNSSTRQLTPAQARQLFALASGRL